jgi:hypothetical protein
MGHLTVVPDGDAEGADRDELLSRARDARDGLTFH